MTEQHWDVKAEGGGAHSVESHTHTHTQRQFAITVDTLFSHSQGQCVEDKDHIVIDDIIIMAIIIISTLAQPCYNCSFLQAAAAVFFHYMYCIFFISFPAAGCHHCFYSRLEGRREHMSSIYSGPSICRDSLEQTTCYCASCSLSK